MTDVEVPLRWDHMRPGNLQEWADLNNLIARFDKTEECFEAADLAEDLESSTFTAEHDSWGIWTGEQLVAMGQILCRSACRRIGWRTPPRPSPDLVRRRRYPRRDGSDPTGSTRLRDRPLFRAYDSPGQRGPARSNRTAA